MHDNTPQTGVPVQHHVPAFSEHSWDDPIAAAIGILSGVLRLSNRLELDTSCPPLICPETGEPYRVGHRPGSVEMEEWISFLDSLLVGLANLSDSAAEVYLTCLTPAKRTNLRCPAPAPTSGWLGKSKRWNFPLIRLLRDIVVQTVQRIDFVRACTDDEDAPAEYRKLLEAQRAYLEQFRRKIELLQRQS